MNDFLSFVITLAGWIGAAATLGAYLLVSQRRIEPDSLLFQGMNLVGAALLGVSATVNGAWPSAAVNYIWILIGVQAVISARHVVRLAIARHVRTVQERARHQRARMQQVQLLPRRVRGARGATRPVTVEEISAVMTGTSLPRISDQEYAQA